MGCPPGCLKTFENCIEKPGIYFTAKHRNSNHVVDLELSAPLLNIMAKMVAQDLKEQIAELEQEYREL